MVLFKLHIKQPLKHVSTLTQISMVLSKDGTSHCLYFINETYSDPVFTSVEDVEDPMIMIMKISKQWSMN
jgi:hypothetical protein